MDNIDERANTRVIAKHLARAFDWMALELWLEAQPTRRFFGLLPQKPNTMYFNAFMHKVAVEATNDSLERVWDATYEFVLSTTEEESQKQGIDLTDKSYRNFLHGQVRRLLDPVVKQSVEATEGRYGEYCLSEEEVKRRLYSYGAYTQGI